jgi:hypothetical protein
MSPIPTTSRSTQGRLIVAKRGLALTRQRVAE